MGRLTANPNAEASASFDLVKPGTYQMRVEAIEDFVSKAGNACWKVRLSFVNPSDCAKLDGTGFCVNPGSIFDNSLALEPSDKQGKVRSFVEACGLPWADVDSNDLVGLTLDAKVGLEEYNGDQKNVIKRYLKKQ